MDRTGIGTHNSRRRRAVLATMVLALGGALLPAAPAAAVTPPQPPVGAYLASTELTAGQFCTSGTPLSRSRTPIVGVSKGTPARNANRPNLKATFEVAPPGQPALVSGTVAFGIGPARFQVPDGVLGEGQYRFRVRAVDGNQVSDWLPWCMFTVDTVNIPTPDAPTSLRISAGPYAGFQFCDTVTPVISTSGGGTFAASPTFSYPTNPNLVGRFEVARTGQEPLIQAGNLNGVGFASALLTAGTHQFRARVEEGNRVSDWSPWCTFVVEPV
jgi:hypothetical protein